MFKRTHFVIAGGLALAAALAIVVTLGLVNSDDGNDSGAALMPLFMDTHTGLEGLTAEAVAGARALDLEIQDQYGVEYTDYWFNEEEGTIYCLFRGPSAEAGEAVHRESHGLTADQIVAVSEGH